MAAIMTSNSTQAMETATITSVRPLYPGGVPIKFSPDGVVQQYPGNTTLCHVPLDSPIQPGLQALSAALKDHPRFLGRLTLLPPSSWHMTVVDGVRREECVPGMWPPGKEGKASPEDLADSARTLSSRLQQLGQRLEEKGLAPAYRMKLRFIDAKNGIGVGLIVEGATAEEEARMRRLRNEIADAMGFRAPMHDTYTFHITVAYFLRIMDEEDNAELDRIFADHHQALSRSFSLGAVEFCTYDNMHSFPRLLYLEKL